MRGMGRMGYCTSRGGGWRRAEHALPFPPMIGPLVGVVLLFATVVLFSDFFPFLIFVWVIPFLLVPMLGLTARGIAGFLAERPRRVSKGDKEKELLEAMEWHGEINPACAALETSLSVSEADRMLSELAKNGYIEVRVREGRLGYALWEHDRSLPEG